MVVDLPHKTGWIMYRKYTANSRKGVRLSDGSFANPQSMNTTSAFPLKKDTLFGTLENGQPQSEYTSSVVELDNVAFTANTAKTLRWSPIVRGSIFAQSATAIYADNGAGVLNSFDPDDVDVVKVNGVRQILDKTTGEPATGTGAGTVDYGSFRDADYADHSRTTVFGSITITAGDTGVALEYQYQNEFVPQNDIPLIGVSDEGIELNAKPRRIAIYFSQLAAFEAQKDYGRDLGAELRERAAFEIQAEIDNEVVERVIECGKANIASIPWYAQPGVGVNMRDHFETLAVALADADAEMYQATNKYSGNYVLIGPKGLRFFSMMAGFKALNSNRFGFGPYVAGELNGHKIIVTPIIRDYAMYVGVNTKDASAILLGIYMAVAPTQLVEFADGGNSQGFSTLYDCKTINPQLVVGINVIDAPDPKVLIQAQAKPSASFTFPGIAPDGSDVTWDVSQ